MEAWYPMLPVAADWFLKGALILSGAFIISGLLRNVEAKWRHLIWVASFGCIGLTWFWVLRPIETKVVQVAISATDASFTAHFTAPDKFPTAVFSTVKPTEAIPRLDLIQAAPLPTHTGFSLLEWALLGIWLFGAGLLLAGSLRQAFRLFQLRRAAALVEEPLFLELAGLLMTHLKVSRKVLFMHHPNVVSPMTWGTIRPIVLIPTDWLAETDDSHEMMLLHELSHVKRYDYLTHQMAQVVSAFHWVNPLVWLARRQMLVERERACDDAVLAQGVRASAYAEQLVLLARTMMQRPSVNVGLGMAQTSELKTRVNAILHESEDRLKRLQWGAVLAMLTLWGLIYMPIPFTSVLGINWQTLPDWVVNYRHTHGVWESPNKPAKIGLKTELSYSALKLQLRQTGVESLDLGTWTEEKQGIERLIQRFENLVTMEKVFLNSAEYPNATRLKINGLRAKLYGLQPEMSDLASLKNRLQPNIEQLIQAQEAGQTLPKEQVRSATLKLGYLKGFYSGLKLEVVNVEEALAPFMSYQKVEASFTTVDALNRELKNIEKDVLESNMVYEFKAEGGYTRFVFKPKKWQQFAGRYSLIPAEK